jgi:ssDNA-binding Zn-finger/Zn-ribbon topoisomerase 1
MTAPPAQQPICQRCRKAVAVTRVKTMRGQVQHACQACAHKRAESGFRKQTLH